MSRDEYNRMLLERLHGEQRWGNQPATGWSMAELAMSAGLPRPEIEDAGGCVTVRFRPTRDVPPQRVGRDLTARQRVILSLLHNNPGGLALREIRAGLGEEPPEWEVKDDLALLKQLELIRSWGHGRGAYWSPVAQ